MPVVVAFPLEEALRIIQAAGCSCAEVEYTSAPGRGHSDARGDRPSREVFVVRQRAVGEGLLVLTAAVHPGPPIPGEGVEADE